MNASDLLSCFPALKVAEAEVCAALLALAPEGAQDAAIGCATGRTVKTVKNLLLSARRALGCANRLALYVLLREQYLKMLFREAGLPWERIFSAPTQG